VTEAMTGGTAVRLYRCGACSRSLALSDFTADRKTGGRAHGICRRCAAARQAAKRETLDGWLSLLHSAAKCRARARGLPFTLTVADVRGLWFAQRGRCALSGLAMVRGRAREGRHYRGPLAPSLDRIDAFGGYVPGNVRFVAFCLNMALNEWGERDVLPVLTAFVDRWRATTIPSPIHSSPHDANDPPA
jgi:hypothetical protein